MKAKAPSMHHQMFGQPLSPEVLAAPRLPSHLVRYFGARSSLTDPRFVAEILRYVNESGSPRRW